MSPDLNMASGLTVISDEDAQAVYGLPMTEKFCIETSDGSGFCSVNKSG